MDITVYLPDELGSRAKEAELPFSGLLRAAVEEELARRAALTTLVAGGEPAEHELDLVDKDGNAYTGVIWGTFLAETKTGGVYYLPQPGTVMVVDEGGDYWTCDEDDKDEMNDMLAGHLDQADLIAVMSRLGLRARVEIDG
jgi:post-segregation antitoxin (ccd killing protein)